MPTVQTQIKLLLKQQSDQGYTVCNSSKYFKKQLHKKSKIKAKKVWNKVFQKFQDIYLGVVGCGEGVYLMSPGHSTDIGL